MMKLPIFLLMATCVIFFTNCAKEHDLTRHIVIEKTQLKEGDNVIYNNKFLEVHAFVEGDQITYTGKTDKGVEGILIFDDDALKFYDDNGKLMLEGKVSCSCKQTQENIKIMEWHCTKDDNIISTK